MAYRIALVACGDWHGALALSGKSDWDLAAADLIALEAGGLITDLDGAKLRYNEAETCKQGVVCGAPLFHAALMRRLRDWRRDREHGEAE
jgi:myo-inositol-1(or 4)-monophosphatase